MIVATFTFRGRLYIVNEYGDVYRMSTNGPTPINWTFEHVFTLNNSL